MSKFTMDEIIDYTEKWLTTGEVNEDMLSDDFHFISPFWESNDKNAFVSKFLDPTEYQQKSLSNIWRFDPIIRLKSDDNRHFSIVLQYHTKYSISVDEAVLGTVKNGLLAELRSIYDLEKTKLAHRL
jgi:hypothetical protein